MLVFRVFARHIRAYFLKRRKGNERRGFERGGIGIRVAQIVRIRIDIESKHYHELGQMEELILKK